MFVGLFVVVAAVCLSQYDRPLLGGQPESFWERVELDCEYCAEDGFKIISAVYGDQVVTGAFNNQYIGGAREFPATDAHWGSTMPG